MENPTNEPVLKFHHTKQYAVRFSRANTLSDVCALLDALHIHIAMEPGQEPPEHIMPFLDEMKGESYED